MTVCRLMGLEIGQPRSIDGGVYEVGQPVDASSSERVGGLPVSEVAISGFSTRP